QFAVLSGEEVHRLEVELRHLADVYATDYGVHDNLTVNARAAGPRLGRDVQTAIGASRTGEWSVSDGVVVAGGIALEEGEYTITPEVDAPAGRDVAAPTPTSGFIVLDLALDEQLLAAGYARGLVRQVQDARKEADLVITDRIELTITVPSDKVAAAEANKEFIADETLARDITIVDGGATEPGEAKVDFTVA